MALVFVELVTSSFLKLGEKTQEINKQVPSTPDYNLFEAGNISGIQQALNS